MSDEKVVATHTVEIEMREYVRGMLWLRQGMADAEWPDGMKVQVAMNINGDCVIVSVDDPKDEGKWESYTFGVQALIDTVLAHREGVKDGEEKETAVPDEPTGEGGAGDEARGFLGVDEQGTTTEGVEGS